MCHSLSSFSGRGFNHIVMEEDRAVGAAGPVWDVISTCSSQPGSLSFQRAQQAMSSDKFIFYLNSDKRLSPVKLASEKDGQYMPSRTAPVVSKLLLWPQSQVKGDSSTVKENWEDIEAPHLS